MSVNKAILIGNLGKDPELKATSSGKMFCRFSLATTEKWKDNSGEQKSKTEWHQIVAWGKQAELCEKYLKKGMPLYVEGRIEYTEYTVDGVKKNATQIQLEKMSFLGSKKDGQGGGDSYEPQEPRGNSDSDSGRKQESRQSTPPPAAAGYDEDIPF